MDASSSSSFPKTKTAITKEKPEDEHCCKRVVPAHSGEDSLGEGGRAGFVLYAAGLRSSLASPLSAAAPQLQSRERTGAWPDHRAPSSIVLVSVISFYPPGSDEDEVKYTDSFELQVIHS